MQILLFNNAIGFGIATLPVLLVWSASTEAQSAALAAFEFLMAAAQACFVNAVARADASFVAPFFYVTLVFAGLYDALIFSVIPDLISLTGAMAILMSAGLLAWRKAFRKTVRPVPPDTP